MSARAEDYLQIVTTVGTQADAERIAMELVERRLAACVQVGGPILSTYRWQGRVETANEWLCVAKTRQELYGAVEAAIRQLHPYDTPEILGVALAAGNDRYLTWLDAQVQRG